MSRTIEGDHFSFATALVKRFHKDALEAVGDQITPEEMELCNQYFHPFTIKSSGIN